MPAPGYLGAFSVLAAVVIGIGLYVYRNRPSNDRPHQSNYNSSSSCSQYREEWDSTAQRVRNRRMEETDGGYNCIICLDSINSNTYTMLVCGDRFHAVCINNWLSTKNTCPICRNLVK